MVSIRHQHSRTCQSQVPLITKLNAPCKLPTPTSSKKVDKPTNRSTMPRFRRASTRPIQENMTLRWQSSKYKLDKRCQSSWHHNKCSTNTSTWSAESPPIGNRKHRNWIPWTPRFKTPSNSCCSRIRNYLALLLNSVNLTRLLTSTLVKRWWGLQSRQCTRWKTCRARSDSRDNLRLMAPTSNLNSLMAISLKPATPKQPSTHQIIPSAIQVQRYVCQRMQPTQP